MKTNIAAFVYIALGGLLATLAACDTTPAPPSSQATQAAILPSQDGPRINSRVFDGRDSLTTGFDGPIATKNNFAVVTQFLEVEGDGGRVGITDPDLLDPSKLLFERRTGAPILAPDGDQVTWGTFDGVRGAVIVKCTRGGTHTTVHLSGLIPNGVYSVWNVLDGIGRADGYVEMDSRRGPTSFRASARGEGHISGITQPGGEIGECMLDDVEAGEYAWQVVGIYHIDGTPDLDQEGTFVEQGGFTFGEPSPPVDIIE